jgi:CDP-diglyceride synthetase
MPEPAKTAISLVATCFVAAAAWILAAQAMGRLRGRRIWTTFFVEILVLAAILVPVFLGPSWFAGAVFAIGVVCGVEVARALQKAGGVGAASLFYPGVFLLFLAALGASPTGPGDVFFCYAMVEINDSCAYLVGATFGKRRPFPTLSPNKTVAGLVGGPLLTVTLSPLFRFAVPGLSLAQVLGAAAMLAVLGTAGDLLASGIKRAAKIKDFGAIVPTHGGVFDVYDSLVFAAPFFNTYLLFCRAR